MICHTEKAGRFSQIWVGAVSPLSSQHSSQQINRMASIASTTSTKCWNCEGLGYLKCNKCHGFGTVSNSENYQPSLQPSRGMFSPFTCSKCNGSGKHQNCRKCKATGSITKRVKKRSSNNSNNTDKINEAFQKGYQAGFADGLAQNQAGGGGGQEG